VVIAAPAPVRDPYLIADQLAHSIPPRSERPLSEVAKRIALPRQHIVSTEWDDIHDICRDDMGIEFDGWQNGMGSLLLSRNARGKFAHTVGGFGLSAMRQIGKTYFFAGAFFGLCQKYPGLLVIWSSHHNKTTGETFQAMQGFASRIRIRPFVESIRTSHGEESIVFHNGSRIMFGAREHGFPRGVPGVDVLMNDEGQILSEKAMQNALATMNTSDIGLHIYAGTPPKPEDIDKSEVWSRMRGEAWVIEDKSVVHVDTEDMVWIEIGADDAADLDDVEQWAKNPSFPHRTPVEAFLRLRRRLNDDGWRREGLGLYDEDEGSIFDMERWKTLAVEDAEQPRHAALVLDVSPDRRWCTIAVAGDLRQDSMDDLERTLVMVNSIRGTQGVVRKIVELREVHSLVDIAITNGAARALETALVDAAIDYETLTQSQMSAAYGNLQRAIKEGIVAHVDQPELNFAMANARSRFLQTGEAEAFDRREYTADTSPAVAAAGALYRWGLQAQPMPVIL
jgi:hypothetical protein